MKRILALAVGGVLPVTAFLLALSLSSVARAGDSQPKLNGHWQFNKDQSDDAQQKIAEAKQNTRSSGTNSGGYPGGGGGGGGYPGGGGGGWPGGGGVGFPGGGMGGGMGRGGMGGRRGGQPTGSGRGVSPEDWDRLAAAPTFLVVDQKSNQVTVTDDAGHTQTLQPDGKKHDVKDENGKKLSTKTEWQDGALVSETKLSHSTKLTQTFRASDDGKHLDVVSRLEDSSLQGPVTVHRAYDLLGGGATAQPASAPK